MFYFDSSNLNVFYFRLYEIETSRINRPKENIFPHGLEFFIQNLENIRRHRWTAPALWNTARIGLFIRNNRPRMYHDIPFEGVVIGRFLAIKQVFLPKTRAGNFLRTNPVFTKWRAVAIRLVAECRFFLGIIPRRGLAAASMTYQKTIRNFVFLKIPNEHSFLPRMDRKVY